MGVEPLSIVPCRPKIVEVHDKKKWTCEYCDNLNEEIRYRCFECGAPRTEEEHGRRRDMEKLKHD